MEKASKNAVRMEGWRKPKKDSWTAGVFPEKRQQTSCQDGQLTKSRNDSKKGCPYWKKPAKTPVRMEGWLKPKKDSWTAGVFPEKRQQPSCQDGELTKSRNDSKKGCPYWKKPAKTPVRMEGWLKPKKDSWTAGVFPEKRQQTSCWDGELTKSRNDSKKRQLLDF